MKDDEENQTGHFLPPPRGMIMGMRRSALMEIAMFLATLLLLDYAFFDQSRYWSLNPHPFWFIIILVSAKYGTKEAIVAAIGASAALLVGNMPEQSIDQDGYAYLLHVLKLPLLWLVTSVMFGELRQLHIRERATLETSLQESQIRAEHIAESYQSVKSVKDQLEMQIAGQLRSSIMAYGAAKSMESLNPDEIMHGLEQMVTATLGPEKFSIYVLSGNGLDVTLMHGWDENDKYQRHFGNESALYENIVGRQNTLCVVNAQQEKLLAGEGILAGPLFNKESGETLGMLKIEKIGFTGLHLGNIEAFGALCEWAGMAIINAKKYETAKAGSIVNPDHNLFTQNYFTRYHSFIAALSRRVNFDVSMLTVQLSHPERFDTDTRMRIARALAEAVAIVLRNVDLAFDHQEQGAEYSIILPATDSKGAEIVIRKIKTELQQRLQQLSAEVTFTIQTIYEKKA